MGQLLPSLTTSEWLGLAAGLVAAIGGILGTLAEAKENKAKGEPVKFTGKARIYIGALCAGFVGAVIIAFAGAHERHKESVAHKGQVTQDSLFQQGRIRSQDSTITALRDSVHAEAMKDSARFMKSMQTWGAMEGKLAATLQRTAYAASALEATTMPVMGKAWLGITLNYDLYGCFGPEQIAYMRRLAEHMGFVSTRNTLIVLEHAQAFADSMNSDGYPADPYGNWIPGGIEDIGFRKEPRKGDDVIEYVSVLDDESDLPVIKYLQIWVMDSVLKVECMQLVRTEDPELPDMYSMRSLAGLHAHVDLPEYGLHASDDARPPKVTIDPYLFLEYPSGLGVRMYAARQGKPNGRQWYEPFKDLRDAMFQNPEPGEEMPYSDWLKPTWPNDPVP